ncbi:unnamed protein product [Somion occarium]|uniref:C2H2-type domain-containing protein n=1 Tax=Somion occarium TaxID=3059160 RepID=A0ABP1D3L0_9APHY
MPRTRAQSRASVAEDKKSNVKKVTCTIEGCDKSFLRRSDMQRHLSTHPTHPKHRNYKCPDCEQGFNQRSALNCHINAHRNLKPYGCDIGPCTKAFADPSSRARHRKEMHSGTVFKCPVVSCKSHYKRESIFTAHLKVKHRISSTRAQRDGWRIPEEDVETPLRIKPRATRAKAKPPKYSSDSEDEIHDASQLSTPSATYSNHSSGSETSSVHTPPPAHYSPQHTLSPQYMPSQPLMGGLGEGFYMPSPSYDFESSPLMMMPGVPTMLDPFSDVHYAYISPSHSPLSGSPHIHSSLSPPSQSHSPAHPVDGNTVTWGTDVSALDNDWTQGSVLGLHGLSPNGLVF